MVLVRKMKVSDDVMWKGRLEVKVRMRRTTRQPEKRANHCHELGIQNDQTALNDSGRPANSKFDSLFLCSRGLLRSCCFLVILF